MPRNKQTTDELLKWAKDRCYIEIYVSGPARVRMFHGKKYPADDFETRYYDCTLRRAILRTQRGEAKRVDTIFKSGNKS